MTTDESPETALGKAPISAVIVVRNEERQMAAVLENILDLVEEILVVDMQSEDRTVEIASRYTSHIRSHPMVPVLDVARNPAQRDACYEWILVIDADERLPDKLKLRIREVVEKDLADYVMIERRAHALGYPLRHGDQRHDWQIRLFKKSFATPWPDTIHVPPQFRGRKLVLPDHEDFTISHYTSPTIDSMLYRIQRYTPKHAIDLQGAGHVFSLSKLIGQPAWFFFRSYFLRRGFRDGIPGLIHAVHCFYYAFVVRARVWENTHFRTPDEKQ